MNGKATFMLILAVVSGLGAMYGTSQLLSKDRGPKPVVMQDVVVAVRNLKVDELLRADLVKITKMPKENVPAGSFTTAKAVFDRFVQIQILTNEPVVDAKLAPKGTVAGLVARIPQGMRAFAIEITETTGVSGFVLPGNHIDIIQSRPNARPGQAETEIVLQNVLVLATGQTFIRPEDKSILARTVTVAVSPNQVETLVAARAKGALTLSLRGVNDTQVVESTPTPAVVPPPPPPQPPPPPPEPEPVARKRIAEADDLDLGPRQKFKRITILHGSQAEFVLVPLPGQELRPDEQDPPGR
jgi:pilus assembly protein CpaB